MIKLQANTSNGDRSPFDGAQRVKNLSALVEDGKNEVYSGMEAKSMGDYDVIPRF